MVCGTDRLVMTIAVDWDIKPHTNKQNLSFRAFVVIPVVIILYLILCMLGNFSCFCCHLVTFFKINFFKILSDCQTV